MAIPLTLACGPYDRTLALALGDVRPAGIDLTYLRLQPHPEAIFWRMSRHQEFDAAEMSLSRYLLRRSRGDDSLQAIPVFPSRFFRHGSVFVNAASGIERPEDLKGKRVGVPEYQITALVWIRGFLEEDYGVRPSDLQWFQGGVEHVRRVLRSQGTGDGGIGQLRSGAGDQPAVADGGGRGDPRPDGRRLLA